MEDEIDFNELENEENSESIEEQQIDENIINDVDDVKPGQLSGYKYLKTPEVGQSIVLEVAKIEKKAGREIKNSKDGSTFMSGLENKKTKTHTEFNIITVNNECFPIQSWGLYYNLFGKDAQFEKKAIEKGTYKGIKVKITHNLNGQDSKTKVPDLMKLRDFKTPEEAIAHKEKVAQAIKEGKIYSVQLVE